MKKWLILLLIPIFSNADVIKSDASGFIIEIEKEVPVSQMNSYQQFLNIGQWWSNEHTWFGEAKNLYIEPRVNGCFCEVNGEQQASHMTVSYIEPNKEIRMRGGLGPLQMLALTGAMSWKFEALTKNTSRITFYYKVSGSPSDNLDKLAPIVNKVQSLQLNRFINIFSEK